MPDFLQYLQFPVLVFFVLQHLLQRHLLARQNVGPEVHDPKGALAGHTLDLVLAVCVLARALGLLAGCLVLVGLRPEVLGVHGLDCHLVALGSGVGLLAEVAASAQHRAGYLIGGLARVLVAAHARSAALRLRLSVLFGLLLVLEVADLRVVRVVVGLVRGAGLLDLGVDAPVLELPVLGQAGAGGRIRRLLARLHCAAGGRVHAGPNFIRSVYNYTLLDFH